MIIRHTFLYQPARWEVEGTHGNAAGLVTPLTGWYLVLHSANRWFLEERLRLEGPEPQAIVNTYTIVPFSADGQATTWSSHRPAVGKMKGRLVVVEDTILSFSHGKERRISGSEWLRRIDDDTYEGRAILLVGDRLLSAWAVTLRRREAVSGER